MGYTANDKVPAGSRYCSHIIVNNQREGGTHDSVVLCDMTKSETSTVTFNNNEAKTFFFSSKSGRHESRQDTVPPLNKDKKIIIRRKGRWQWWDNDCMTLVFHRYFFCQRRVVNGDNNRLLFGRDMFRGGTLCRLWIFYLFYFFLSWSDSWKCKSKCDNRFKEISKRHHKKWSDWVGEWKSMKKKKKMSHLSGKKLNKDEDNHQLSCPLLPWKRIW